VGTFKFGRPIPGNERQLDDAQQPFTHGCQLRAIQASVGVGFCPSNPAV
jgi:hypothetical protein